MVRRPARALLSSPRVGSVVVLAQEPERIAAALPADPRLSVRRSGATIAATLLDLCSHPDTQWPLLVTTADHALLDTGMVDDFCAAAEGSDLAVGVVEKALLQRRLPATRRTWLRFRAGAYSGANLFALTSPKVRAAIELWRTAEQNRKKGLRLLFAAGPILLAGAAARLLTLDQVLDRLGRRLGLKLTAVRMTNPLAAVDVDKADDHALVEAILEGGV